MKVSNRGEWICQKRKVKRGWIKVVFLGDIQGNIIDVRIGNEILGYSNWSDQEGYGFKWPAIEGIFSAIKRIFGESVSCPKTRNMYHEARLKFWFYQQLRSM